MSSAMATGESGSAPDPPQPVGGRRRRWRKVATGVVGLVAALGFAGVYGVHHELQQSLPLLEGGVVVPSLADPVVVERDGLGIPTIRADDRMDAARAMGFLHAQERFFQMDLFRRQAAGELAALVGADLVERDRETRIHRFRRVAEQSWERSAGRARRIVAAYTEGVNAGLSALREVPPEYLLLGVDPRPWEPEDSYLVLLSLFLELQDESGSREGALGVLYDALPVEVAEFLAPVGSEWDAPVRGGLLGPAPVPGADVLGAPAAGAVADRADGPPGQRRLWDETPAVEIGGSNSWAVSGDLTGHGGALLANDMHLHLSVPNMWYRLQMLWPADREGGEGTLVGASLPGLPLVVIGSNGRVAWGLTNSWIDTSDLVVLEAGPTRDQYLTPEGPRNFRYIRESIAVRSEEPRELEVKATIWGPVVRTDYRGRDLALRWVAHDAEAVDFAFLGIEGASTVAEGIALATRSGGPQLNLVLADSEGRIGWTLTGKVPRRVDLGGRVPRSWADGRTGWDGWLAPAEIPRVLDPPSGRIWSANNRMVGGDALKRLGDGGYLLGARAHQIRDALFAADVFDEHAMLELQLDDRALFYGRWRKLFLEVAAGDVRVEGERAKARELVEDWGGRASVDSVGFRLVRAFRLLVQLRVREMVTRRCRELDPELGEAWAAQFEAPLWTMVTTRPAHLLDPELGSWEALLDEQMNATLAFFRELGGELSDHPWGEANTVQVRHVLSAGLPWLEKWLDMPPAALPGAERMPRFQTPDSGSSQRMVVAPGREERGIFHMPGGQSGHPLSLHYRDAHARWVQGAEQPLMPGPPVSTLTLWDTPGRSRSERSEEIR